MVIVQDSNQIQGHWKLARVSNVFPSKDGLVRHAEIQYKNLLSTKPPKIYNGKSYTTTERLVQHLIVIVTADYHCE